MGRAIASVVLGYVMLAATVFFTFTAAYLILGRRRLVQARYL
jgi:hypothetical protein